MSKHSDEKSFSHILFVNRVEVLQQVVSCSHPPGGDCSVLTLLKQMKQKPKAKSLSAKKIFLKCC